MLTARGLAIEDSIAVFDMNFTIMRTFLILVSTLVGPVSEVCFYLVIFLLKNVSVVDLG